MRPRSRTRKFAYFILAMTALIGIYQLSMSLTKWRADAIVFSPNTQYGDDFGTAIAVDGETVVVGAPGNDSVSKPGAAYVYDHSGESWQLKARLTELSPRFENREGFAQYTAIDNNRIAISGSDSGLREYGVIYIFERQGENWIQQTKLSPPPKTKAQIFPNKFTGNIILQDDFLIVAARAAVYVYAQNPTTKAWTYEARLPFAAQLPEELRQKQDNRCGVGETPVIAMSGNTLVVGNKTFGFNTAGYCADVLVRNPTTRQWTHQATLVPDSCQTPFLCRSGVCKPNPSCEGVKGFSNAVAIDGNTIVVGTSTELPGPFDYCDENGSNAAYIFERTPETGIWKQTAILYPKGLFARYLASRCGFGDVVAVKGDVAVVMGLRAVAHLFKRDRETGQWHYQVKLPYDGQSINLSRRQLMIGDIRISNKESSSGRSGGIYSFDLRGTQFLQ